MQGLLRWRWLAMAGVFLLTLVTAQPQRGPHFVPLGAGVLCRGTASPPRPGSGFTANTNSAGLGEWQWGGAGTNLETCLQICRGLSRWRHGSHIGCKFVSHGSGNCFVHLDCSHRDVDTAFTAYERQTECQMREEITTCGSGMTTLAALGAVDATSCQSECMQRPNCTRAYLSTAGACSIHTIQDTCGAEIAAGAGVHSLQSAWKKCCGRRCGAARDVTWRKYPQKSLGGRCTRTATHSGLGVDGCQKKCADEIGPATSFYAPARIPCNAIDVSSTACKLYSCPGGQVDASDTDGTDSYRALFPTGWEIEAESGGQAQDLSSGAWTLQGPEDFDTECAADYGSSSPCCSQSSPSSVPPERSCPVHLPKCIGYVANSRWGHCGDSDSCKSCGSDGYLCHSNAGAIANCGTFCRNTPGCVGFGYFYQGVNSGKCCRTKAVPSSFSPSSVDLRYASLAQHTEEPTGWNHLVGACAHPGGIAYGAYCEYSGLRYESDCRMLCASWNNCRAAQYRTVDNVTHSCRLYQAGSAAAGWCPHYNGFNTRNISALSYAGTAASSVYAGNSDTTGAWQCSNKPNGAPLSCPAGSLVNISVADDAMLASGTKADCTTKGGWRIAEATSSWDDDEFGHHSSIIHYPTQHGHPRTYYPHLGTPGANVGTNPYQSTATEAGFSSGGGPILTDAWCPPDTLQDHWIQFNLGATRILYGAITQGRAKFSAPSCAESTSAPGYSLSHSGTYSMTAGTFHTGPEQVVTVVSDLECAMQCTADISCVAFSRHQTSGACYKYDAQHGASVSGSADKTYTRCPGLSGGMQWVTKYVVKYSMDGTGWSALTDGKGSQMEEFKANFDDKTAVSNFFPTPVSARYARIYPTAWFNYPSMRVSFIGCAKDFSNAIPNTPAAPRVSFSGTSSDVSTYKLTVSWARPFSSHYPLKGFAVEISDGTTTAVRNLPSHAGSTVFHSKESTFVNARYTPDQTTAEQQFLYLGPSCSTQGFILVSNLSTGAKDVDRCAQHCQSNLACEAFEVTPAWTAGTGVCQHAGSTSTSGSCDYSSLTAPSICQNMCANWDDCFAVETAATSCKLFTATQAAPLKCPSYHGINGSFAAKTAGTATGSAYGIGTGTSRCAVKQTGSCQLYAPPTASSSSSVQNLVHQDYPPVLTDHFLTDSRCFQKPDQRTYYISDGRRYPVRSHPIPGPLAVEGYVNKGRFVCTGTQLASYGPAWNVDRGITACKAECDGTASCDGFVWFEDFSCRTYDDCSTVQLEDDVSDISGMYSTSNGKCRYSGGTTHGGFCTYSDIDFEVRECQELCASWSSCAAVGTLTGGCDVMLSTPALPGCPAYRGRQAASSTAGTASSGSYTGDGSSNQCYKKNAATKLHAYQRDSSSKVSAQFLESLEQDTTMYSHLTAESKQGLQIRPATTYSVTLHAINDIGNASSSSSYTTQAAVPSKPGKPLHNTDGDEAHRSLPHTSSVTATSLTLSWAPAQPNGASVSGYLIQYKTGLQWSGNMTGFQGTVLRVLNASGASTRERDVTCARACSEYSECEVWVRVVNQVSSCSLKKHFVASGGLDRVSEAGRAHRGNLRDYSYTDGHAGEVWQTLVLNTNSDATSRVIENLIPGESYVFRVSAINSVGTSWFFSDPSESIQTLEVLAHQVPAPQVTQITQQAGLVQWEVPFRSGGNMITHYVLHVTEQDLHDGWLTEVSRVLPPRHAWTFVERPWKCGGEADIDLGPQTLAQCKTSCLSDKCGAFYMLSGACHLCICPMGRCSMTLDATVTVGYFLHGAAGLPPTSFLLRGIQRYSFHSRGCYSSQGSRVQCSNYASNAFVRNVPSLAACEDICTDSSTCTDYVYFPTEAANGMSNRCYMITNCGSYQAVDDLPKSGYSWGLLQANQPCDPGQAFVNYPTQSSLQNCADHAHRQGVPYFVYKSNGDCATQAAAVSLESCTWAGPTMSPTPAPAASAWSTYSVTPPDMHAFYDAQLRRKEATSSCISGSQTWVVPQGCTEVFVSMWGAGGGGGFLASDGGAGGGGGGYASGFLKVTPGASMEVIVGEGGVTSMSQSAGAFGGGGRVSAAGAGEPHGGSGGGRSAIVLNSVDQVTAAGGGGGGGAAANGGGAGGGTTGLGGSGGTATAKGTGGSAEGSQHQGSMSTVSHAGGGGGGWYGGGAGASTNQAGSGGSSYVSVLREGVTEAGTNGYARVGGHPGGASDSNYPGENVGRGGSPGHAGANGYIVLSDPHGRCPGLPGGLTPSKVFAVSVAAATELGVAQMSSPTVFRTLAPGYSLPVSLFTLDARRTNTLLNQANACTDFATCQGTSWLDSSPVPNPAHLVTGSFTTSMVGSKPMVTPSTHLQGSSALAALLNFGAKSPQSSFSVVVVFKMGSSVYGNTVLGQGSGTSTDTDWRLWSTGPGSTTPSDLADKYYFSTGPDTTDQWLPQFNDNSPNSLTCMTLSLDMSTGKKLGYSNGAKVMDATVTPSNKGTGNQNFWMSGWGGNFNQVSFGHLAIFDVALSPTEHVGMQEELASDWGC